MISECASGTETEEKMSRSAGTLKMAQAPCRHFPTPDHFSIQRLECHKLFASFARARSHKHIHVFTGSDFVHQPHIVWEALEQQKVKDEGLECRWPRRCHFSMTETLCSLQRLWEAALKTERRLGAYPFCLPLSSAAESGTRMCGDSINCAVSKSG